MNLELVNVYDFLAELGVRNLRENGEEVEYSCPFSNHKNGDSNPSASMQIGTTQAHCFGCGWSGNAVSFLASLEDATTLQAMRWLRERFGGGFQEPEDTILTEINNMLESANDRKPFTERKQIISEGEVTRRIVDWHSIRSDDPRHYIIDRGFTPSTLIEWEIGWDIISERFTIPVRDEEDNLLGFKARALVGVTPKYLTLGGPEYGFDSFETSSVLFGLNHWRVSNIEELLDGVLILCEGELNTIAMHQAGHTNAVGISGKFLSAKQVQLIVKYAFGAILIFDEQDDAKRAAKKLEPYIPVRIAPPHNHDPAEMVGDEITSLVVLSSPSLLL